MEADAARETREFSIDALDDVDLIFDSTDLERLDISI